MSDALEALERVRISFINMLEDGDRADKNQAVDVYNDACFETLRAALQPKQVDLERPDAVEEYFDLNERSEEEGAFIDRGATSQRHRIRKAVIEYIQRLEQGHLTAQPEWDGKMRRIDDGVEIHKRHWLYPMIEKAHNEGLSARAISRIFPVSHDTVARIVRFLPTPPKQEGE